MMKKRAAPRPATEAMMDNIASIAGMTSTKLGSDDKETGYIVRQNSMLKCLLFCIVFMAMVGMGLLSTVYELKIAKRGLVYSETYHLQRERHDHKHLMNLAIDLQQSLEHNLQSSSLVEELRAMFGKLAGNHEARLNFVFKNVATKPQMDEMQRHHVDFVQQMDSALTRVVNTLQKNNAESKDKIHKISQLVISEINAESLQSKRYAEKMEELDVDEDYINSLQVEDDDDDQSDEGVDGVNDDDLDTDQELASHLDTFFTKLQQLPALDLDPVAITQMEQAYQDFSIVLGDDNKDADLDLFAEKMYKLSGGMRPPSTTLAGGKESVMEYYSNLIETAKLAPYKQNLVDLYNGWKSPDSQLTVREVLAEVQNVAQQSQLSKIFDLMHDDAVEED